MKRTILVISLVVLATALVAALPAAATTIPVYKGTVGPGFTIKLSKTPTKAGKATFVLSDLSSSHDFHLIGKGVNVKTSVAGTGTKRFTVTLQKGTYRFMCDPHKSFMKGSFQIR